MKAVLLRGKGEDGSKVKLAEVGVPDIGPGDLLVKMSVCGLCGTDIEKINGEYTAAMPVLGHEAVGEVTGVGDGVVGFKVGDRVFPHHHVSCGVCYYCRHGSPTMCVEYRRSNLDPGGFAEYFLVPEQNIKAGGVLKLPPNVSMELGSLTEPLACCIRAQDRVSVAQGDNVLVVGAGPVGMMHALLLGRKKATVTISDVSQARLKSAEERHAGTVLDAMKADVPNEVRKQTDGRGADIAIIASGSPKAIIQGLKSVRKGGKVCLFGVPGKGSVLDYDISDVYNAEVNVVTTYGGTEAETVKALELLASGAIPFGSLITDRFPLSQFDEALKKAAEARALKVLITP